MWLPLLLVGAAVLAVHWPALSVRAIASDDQEYVLDNRLVNDPGWPAVGRVFGEVLHPSTVSGYYQPLAMSSLMLDRWLGGRPDNLRPYHRTSLGLHVLNAVLLTLLVSQLFGRPWVGAAAGLLFGVHPLTVETVAWLAERKTLLATAFSYGALISYVAYTRRGQVPLLVASLLAFALALLSKPTSTMLPLVLLLLDYWPLRRLRWGSVVEKIPFFVLALISGVVTIVSQRQAGGVSVAVVDSALRVPLSVAHNLVFYPLKLVWPANVSSYYAYPEPFALTNAALLVGVIGAPLLLAGLLVSWRWTRALLTGWLIFVVAVFPTLGVINFTDVIAANRYVYLPVLGFVLILAWGLCRIDERVRRSRHVGVWRAVVIVLVLGVASANGWLSREQLGYWQTSEGLHRYMLRFAPGAGTLHVNLAADLVKQGRIGEAIDHYEQALRSNASRHVAHYNLGVLYGREGRNAEAKQHYVKALPSKAFGYRAQTNLGLLLAREGRVAEALEQLEAALSRAPRYQPAADVLVNVVMSDGRRAVLERAWPILAERVRQLPRSAAAHNDLANVLAGLGKREAARENFERALELDAGYALAHLDLGSLLIEMGELDSAVEHLQAAIRLEPELPAAYGNLGRVYEMRGRADLAAETYRAGLRFTPKDAWLRSALERVSGR